MSYRINGTVVIDNSRKVYACCVDAKCIRPSVRFDAPSGTTAQRPSVPATGSIYFDTDEGALLTYDGTEWKAGGSAPNGIDGSVTYVSSANTPYQAVLERYDQIGMCCVCVASEEGHQSATNLCALGSCTHVYSVSGGGSACGANTFINNLVGDAALCCRAYVTRTSGISPHILSDGSMFSYFNYDRESTNNSGFLYYYNYTICSLVNTVTSFACLMASDGRNGHLTFPISFGKSSGSFSNTDALCFGCFYTSSGFTHPFVPWADGPKGKLTVGSSLSTYPGKLMGVTDSCNFGKTKFDFDYLVCETVPCYVFHRDSLYVPSKGHQNFFGCCTCVTAGGVEDYVTLYESLYAPACMCKYIKCCQLYTRIAMFSKENLACKSTYCTLASDYTYAANPLTGQVVCRHERCTYANDYGLMYAGCVALANACISCFNLPNIMSLCTDKHFVFHCEYNPVCTCCNVGTNCAGTFVCKRYLPMVEVFDIANMCKVCCASYKCWLNGPTSCCWWELPCAMTTTNSSLFYGMTCRFQDPNTPEKHYMVLSSTPSCFVDSICATAPCVAQPGAILTFCETTLNFTAENPWAGLTCARNGVNSYLSLGCFRPNPSSCGFKYACLGCSARLCQFCTVKGNFLTNSSSTNDLSKKYVINPETNSIVTHFELEFNCQVYGIYLACYSLTNKCWTEGAVVWDSEKEYEQGGTCISSKLMYPNSCVGTCHCRFVIGFSCYDTGSIFEFSANASHALAANCSDFMSICCEKGICHPCCSAGVKGYVHHMTFKLPNDKKFCDIPGLIPDPCVPALLNYNVVQDICFGRAGYKESAELWSCICVGKRFTGTEFVGIVKPTDCLMLVNNAACYCCGLGTCTPPLVCDGTSLTNCMKIFTMSQETGQYHSDFIQDRLGLTITPSISSKSSPGSIFGTSDHTPSEVKINTQTNCLYRITPPTSGITYCTV